ncbi:MAG: hypothetical protein JSS40_14385 [Proteobacteria bacterium]|nr:hypothetical protein [Pseudomonadota bacterium]
MCFGGLPGTQGFGCAQFGCGAGLDRKYFVRCRRGPGFCGLQEALLRQALFFGLAQQFRVGFGACVGGGSSGTFFLHARGAKLLRMQVGAQARFVFGGAGTGCVHAPAFGQRARDACACGQFGGIRSLRREALGPLRRARAALRFRDPAYVGLPGRGSALSKRQRGRLHFSFLDSESTHLDGGLLVRVVTQLRRFRRTRIRRGAGPRGLGRKAFGCGAGPVPFGSEAFGFRALVDGAGMRGFGSNAPFDLRALRILCSGAIRGRGLQGLLGRHQRSRGCGLLLFLPGARKRGAAGLFLGRDACLLGGFGLEVGCNALAMCDGRGLLGSLAREECALRLLGEALAFNRFGSQARFRAGMFLHDPARLQFRAQPDLRGLAQALLGGEPLGRGCFPLLAEARALGGLRSGALGSFGGGLRHAPGLLLGFEFRIGGGADARLGHQALAGLFGQPGFGGGPCLRFRGGFAFGLDLGFGQDPGARVLGCAGFGREPRARFVAGALLGLGLCDGFGARAFLRGCAGGCIGLGAGLDLHPGAQFMQFAALDLLLGLGACAGVLAGAARRRLQQRLLGRKPLAGEVLRALLGAGALARLGERGGFHLGARAGEFEELLLGVPARLDRSLFVRFGVQAQLGLGLGLPFRGDPRFQLVAGGALHRFALLGRLAQAPFRLRPVVPRDGRLGFGLDACDRLLDGGVFGVPGARGVQRVFGAHGAKFRNAG